jgi:hypothetical protein
MPSEALVWVEAGTTAPKETGYDAFVPFTLAWVITNGSTQRIFLWVTLRKTGIYVAFGGPFHMHASYHTNGRFHWKTDTFTQELVSQPPLPNIPGPVLMMSATTSISDDVLGRFKLAEFRNRRADRVIFMDNRMLPENLH